MCTFYHHGSADDPRLAARSLAREIYRRGHGIRRLKCEMELSLDDDERWSLPVGHVPGYYEAHIKLPLAISSRHALERLARSTGLAISWSLMRPREDGRRKWFLTDRIPGDVYADDARSIFAESIAIVHEAFPGAHAECEAVLLDTAPELDSGWTNADLKAI